MAIFFLRLRLCDCDGDWIGWFLGLIWFRLFGLVRWLVFLFFFLFFFALQKGRGEAK